MVVALTCPTAVSTARHRAVLNRFANVAAVVDGAVGTGDNTSPAASARRRSRPTR